MKSNKTRNRQFKVTNGLLNWRFLFIAYYKLLLLQQNSYCIIDLYDFTLYDTLDEMSVLRGHRNGDTK